MGFTPHKAHRVLLCIGSGGLTRCAGGGENFEPDNGIVSRGCASTISPGAVLRWTPAAAGKETSFAANHHLLI